MTFIILIVSIYDDVHFNFLPNTYNLGLSSSGLTNTGGNPLLQQLQVGFSNDNFHSLGVSSSAANFTSTKPLGSLSAFPPQPAQPGQPQQLSGNQRVQADKLRQSKEITLYYGYLS